MGSCSLTTTPEQSKSSNRAIPHNAASRARQALDRKIEIAVSLIDDDCDHFLPINALSSVLTDTIIRQILDQTDETCDLKVEDIIGSKKRLKILAILLLLGGNRGFQHISHLVEQNITDAHLPLQTKHLMHCRGSIRRFLNNCSDPSHDELSLGSNDLEVSSSVHDAPGSLANLFRFTQFLVDIPTWTFYSKNIEKIQFHKDHRLPFLCKHWIASGGQGTVWKVRIHAAHFQTKIETVGWILKYELS